MIRDDGQAVPDEQAEMVGVEVGDTEVPDPALAAQTIELEHRVEISGVSVLPPVKLEQIDAVYL